MKKFIDLFHKRLRAKLGVIDEQKFEQLVFRDYKSLPFGGEWSKDLAAAVVVAETYLCLVSPTYLNSPWCGREFEIALNRLNSWQQSAAGSREGRFIFPVRWEQFPNPDKIHPKLDKFLHKNDDFPKIYQKESLQKLASLRKNRDNFNLFVDALAEEIATILNNTHKLPAAPAITDFEKISSAFAPELTPYGILLWCSKEAETNWSLVFDGCSLRELVGNVANSMYVPIQVFDPGKKPERSIQQAVADRQIVLIIADATTAIDFAVMAAAANPKDINNLALIAVDTQSTQGAPVLQLADWLAKFPAYPTLNRLAAAQCAVVCLPSNLEKEIEILVTRVRTAMVNGDPAEKVEDVALTKKAADAGIPTGAKPCLAGPGQTNGGKL